MHLIQNIAADKTIFLGRQSAATHRWRRMTDRHTRVTILCMRTLLALGCLALIPGPARATTPIAEVICASRADIVLRLTRQYRAQLSGNGIRDPESVMEIWSDAEGRWTLVQRNANGTSCILAMGEHWNTVDPA